MKILAIESSGGTAGCALMCDGKLTAEFYVNSKLTHSKTLLPMIDDMLKINGMDINEIDAAAVSKGPGSFTGLRIGAATAKGLTLLYDKPIIPVSSLMGLSVNTYAPDMIMCPVMDARRGEVYCAAYTRDGEVPEALLEDAALTIDEYLIKVKETAERENKKCCFLGDGVPVHKEKIVSMLGSLCTFAPEHLSLQRAAGIALLGGILYSRGISVRSDDFVPGYLRRPLAEKEKEEGILGDAGQRSLNKISRGDFKRTKHPLTEQK